MTYKEALDIVLAGAEIDLYEEAKEMVTDACERSDPRKLTHFEIHQDTGVRVGYCPHCGNYLMQSDLVRSTDAYCEECGQAIDYGYDD